MKQQRPTKHLGHLVLLRGHLRTPLTAIVAFGMLFSMLCNSTKADPSNRPARSDFSANENQKPRSKTSPEINQPHNTPQKKRSPQKLKPGPKSQRSKNSAKKNSFSQTQPKGAFKDQSLKSDVLKIIGSIVLTGFVYLQLGYRKKNRIFKKRPHSLPQKKHPQPLENHGAKKQKNAMDSSAEKTTAQDTPPPPQKSWAAKVASRISAIPLSFSRSPSADGDSNLNEEHQDPFEKAQILFGTDSMSKKNALGQELAELEHSTKNRRVPGMEEDSSPARSGSKKNSIVVPFPDGLGEHFQAEKNEHLIWFQTFFQGTNEGLIAVSNRRILHVYERQILQIFPPGFKLIIEKHQFPLANLRVFRRRLTREKHLLVAAAPFVLWFPLGTFFSLMLLGVYFGRTRKELALGAHEEDLKSYHLPEETQDQLMRVFRRLKNKKKLGRKNIPVPHAS